MDFITDIIEYLIHSMVFNHLDTEFDRMWD